MSDGGHKICGLPPCCVMSWGMMAMAGFMCGAIGLSRHTGLLSQDPLLPPCDPLLLAKAPGLRAELKALPDQMKALSVSLGVNASAATSQSSPEHARAELEKTIALIRKVHEAKRLLRCEGGAISLGEEAAIVDHAQRALWRLHSRARKLAPATAAAAMRRKRKPGHEPAVAHVAHAVPGGRARARADDRGAGEHHA